MPSNDELAKMSLERLLTSLISSVTNSQIRSHMTRKEQIALLEMADTDTERFKAEILSRVSKPAPADSLFLVHRVYQFHHHDDYGSGDGESVIHVAASVEDATETMNAYFEKQLLTDKKMICRFEKGKTKSTKSSNYNGGGYARYEVHYEIKPVPKIS